MGGSTQSCDCHGGIELHLGRRFSLVVRACTSGPGQADVPAQSIAESTFQPVLYRTIDPASEHPLEWDREGLAAHEIRVIFSAETLTGLHPGIWRWRLLQIDPAGNPWLLIDEQLTLLP